MMMMSVLGRILICTCGLAQAFAPSSTYPTVNPWDVTGLGPAKGYVTARSAPFLLMENLADTFQTSPTAMFNGGAWTSKRLHKKLATLAMKVEGAAALLNAKLYVAKAWSPASDGTSGNCKATGEAGRSDQDRGQRESHEAFASPSRMSVFSL